MGPPQSSGLLLSGRVVTRGLGHIVASRVYLEVAWADACTAFGESAKSIQRVRALFG